ncbi:hypothetical protein [Streptomyces nanshensis]|uniref:Uncharacterized protein n=1 Tax=Streptomyces nanshensis TaxID=518642 RepID=A0A1E7KZI2_9ACTN|nr:hypothetical protein [Streptomyces nanshensis]OEV09291.1 hypothetical protein AN218_22885 [Streptomyces nanshensis]
MSGGYTFDPKDVKKVERGLKDAIAELEEIGLFSITSQQGNGFSRLAMSGLATGDAQLASALEEFCDRWGFAVKEKIHDANQMAVGLRLNAGLYHEQEQYVIDSLKELAAAGSNDPLAGMRASDGAAGKSWEQIQKDNTKGAGTDYSLPDFEEMGDQWKQVGQDASTSSPTGGSAATGGGAH